MRFQCPKCETAFDVPEDHPEDVVACEQCGTSLSIRPAEPEILGPPVAGRSRYRDRGAAADPEAMLRSMITTIDEFWVESHEAWLSGKLHAVIPKAVEAASAVDVEGFAVQFKPKTYKALFFLLREYGPLMGEYYCGGMEKDCAVTNFRLVIRNAPTMNFTVIPLAMLTGRVDEKGWWTKTATYHLKNGKTMVFSKLGAFIPDENIQALQKLEDCYSLPDDVMVLTGNVDP